MKRNVNTIQSILVTFMLIAIASPAKAIEIELVKTFKGHDADTYLAFSPDGKTLISCSPSDSFKFWDTKTWEANRTIPLDSEEEAIVFFSPDSKTMTASGKKTISVWDVQSGLKMLSHERKRAGRQCMIEYSIYGDIVCAFDINGDALYWDLITKKPIENLPPWDVTWAAFSPDDLTLATYSSITLGVNFWDIETGEPGLSFPYDNPPGPFCPIAFSPSEKMFATGSMKGYTVYLCNEENGEILSVLQGSPSESIEPKGAFDLDSIHSIKFSNNGEYLAAVREDGKIDFHNVKTVVPAIILDLEYPVGEFLPYSVAFNADWSLLATGSKDGTIKIWKIKSAH